MVSGQAQADTFTADSVGGILRDEKNGSGRGRRIPRAFGYERQRTGRRLPAADRRRRTREATMISGARKTELFMGQPYRTMPVTSRNRGWAPLSTRACAARPRPPMDRRSEAAERRGHGRAPYSAARDPVFFAHHGNIERLWIEAPALTHALSSFLIFARIEDGADALLRKILAFLSHQISHEIKITRVLRGLRGVFGDFVTSVHHYSTE
ncbi:hypothetical protein OsI_17485 [Oryza sativa Indica Group]|uniref:Tyrosinase copper-binding domain-containing protein n=1 Tax=Oryza sativa subsp. indica TaxID=39946 RepID=A2XXR8_ORYSI|nr:hypothetical protein OsI_17485 [Oryza sativa Indica Group]